MDIVKEALLDAGLPMVVIVLHLHLLGSLIPRSQNVDHGVELLKLVMGFPYGQKMQ